MSFSTSISAVWDGGAVIRGRSHAELIANASYFDVAFLTLTGRLPSDVESRLFQGMAISVIDHGFVSVTTTVGRYAASGNPQLVSAVAAGLLAAGENTLSPGPCYDMLGEIEDQIDSGLQIEEAARAHVRKVLADGGRLPGFGHPTHRGLDYRAVSLFELADQLGVGRRYVRVLEAVRTALHEILGKTHIPINIDGCMAALAREMGLTRNQAVAIALIGVVPGLLAHVTEQIEFGRPLQFAEGAYESAEAPNLITEPS